MELLTLDSNYQPAEIVERYASLIWTERYFKAGDFSLKTTDVERMINLLPLESTVTLRDSTVPMIVEVHNIKKEKGGAPVLTVSGRSFETVLDRRVSVKVAGANGPRIPWTENRNKESDAAYQAIRQTIGDGILAPINSPNDALPMVNVIVPADYSTGTTIPYEIKPGSLYDTVLELLATNYHGLKAVRPVLGATKIGLEIYNGADLTDVVSFDARFDQFTEANYLLSYLGSANWAYVFSSTVSQTVAKTTAPEPTGLDRRVIYVDVSSEDGTNSEEARRTRGLIELYKLNALALFDGQIAEQIAAGYNRDYFLGDIIQLTGEYGLSENVRVTEFIRSDDNTGSKSYPTFETVS